jgi:hypothetical protein
METIVKQITALAIVLACALSLSGNLHAALVFDQPSFESPVNTAPDGDNRFVDWVPAGWTVTAGRPETQFMAREPVWPGLPPGDAAHDGIQFLVFTGDFGITMYHDLGTLDDAAYVTFHAYVAARQDLSAYAPVSYTLSLYADDGNGLRDTGDSLVATATNPTTPVDTAWLQASTPQTALLSADTRIFAQIYVPDTNEIRNQTLLDSVSVTLVTIPEPASLALIGLGGLIFLGRRRRCAR